MYCPSPQDTHPTGTAVQVSHPYRHVAEHQTPRDICETPVYPELAEKKPGPELPMSRLRKTAAAAGW